MTVAARLLRLAGIATFGAGVVAVARQRAEQQAVAAGAIAPAHAATTVVAGHRPGPLARAVAGVVPEGRPRGVAFVAGVAWAAPVSVAGLALGTLVGGRPRWDDEHGLLVFEGARGPFAGALRAVGASANTVGHVVISRHERTPPLLLAHEAGHVRQHEVFGLGMVPLYAWLGARYGYRDHPLERGARAYARGWRERRDPAAEGRVVGGGAGAAGATSAPS